MPAASATFLLRPACPFNQFTLVQRGGSCPFRCSARFAKPLTRRDGRVAEWFKAPVLKFYHRCPSSNLRGPYCIDLFGVYGVVNVLDPFLSSLIPDGSVAISVATACSRLRPGLTHEMNQQAPNFHFHAVTAYDILRSRGVPLGKRDYEGRLRTGPPSPKSDSATDS